MERVQVDFGDAFLLLDDLQRMGEQHAPLAPAPHSPQEGAPHKSAHGALAEGCNARNGNAVIPAGPQARAHVWR